MRPRHSAASALKLPRESQSVPIIGCWPRCCESVDSTCPIRLPPRSTATYRILIVCWRQLTAASPTRAPGHKEAAPMSQTFMLPDVGEGLTEAEIVSWRVAVGEDVEVNDIICEIETAKSLVELPVPFGGTVEELVAAEGETVEVGQPLIRISGGDDAEEAAAAAGEKEQPAQKKPGKEKPKEQRSKGSAAEDSNHAL